ncbi:hypothetical protein OAF63_04015 [Saprospiraceae bacterium]|jgi:hypothetical protein|nr:hypothetical protein [Bacteroidota bacterium]MDB4727935.1 hypothetical protein [Saprospiraceae bacterium]MDF1864722.1 hypothetical protein [Saprospiraceae bacterium]
MNQSIQFRNDITKEIVKKAAEHLILTNGQTTSLEVKEYLRNQYYNALQDEVSILLDTISIEQDWYCAFNGTYRVFAFQQPSGLAAAWGILAFSDN